MSDVSRLVIRKYYLVIQLILLIGGLIICFQYMAAQPDEQITLYPLPTFIANQKLVSHLQVITVLLFVVVFITSEYGYKREIWIREDLMRYREETTGRLRKLLSGAKFHDDEIEHWLARVQSVPPIKPPAT